MSEQVQRIPVSQLHENPLNPRRSWGSLTELGKTIKKQGLIEPVIARKLPDGTLQIVAGHRRTRAAKLVGIKELDVVIRSLNAQESLETAIVENREHQGLNALEEAEGFAKLMSDFGLTADQVADRVEASKSSVYQAIGLLELPEHTKKALLAEKITASAALELTKVRGSERLQLQALNDVLKLGKNGEKASARAVQRMIRDKYLSATSKHGNSRAQRETKEHGADVALHRRVVARLLGRVAELVERRAHLDETDLRTAIIALAEQLGEPAREVFQRRGLRVDRLGKVNGAQLRSLLIELSLVGWLTLDEKGEYSAAVRATAKAYNLSLSELTAGVEADSLFEKA
jgi:ParB family chromosome partitioning protein